jgi:uncharacterized protein YegP (UPF0339 family)
VIEVAVRPSPVGVDLLHAPVVVIDMQNDFAAPDGMFDGKYWFRLKAANGEIVATSEAYETKASAKNGIASVQKSAPRASVVDLTEWAVQTASVNRPCELCCSERPGRERRVNPSRAVQDPLSCCLGLPSGEMLDLR